MGFIIKMNTEQRAIDTQKTFRESYNVELSLEEAKIFAEGIFQAYLLVYSRDVLSDEEKKKIHERTENKNSSPSV